MIKFEGKAFLIVFSVLAITYGQDNSSEAFKIDTQEVKEALALSDEILNREVKGLKIHKSLAFTTGGLLLLSDAMGAYHFYSMLHQGHVYRDKYGYNERNVNENDRKNEIVSIWKSSESQTEKTIHAALISASTVFYTATATIELTLPRFDKDTSMFSRPNIHRDIFYLHAALMLANIGLGFAESFALSQGNHDLVVGLGVTHMVIGIAAPAVMFGSGLVFKY